MSDARYGEDTQLWTTHVRPSGPGAGEHPWRALLLIAYPTSTGVFLSLRTKSGRGGNHAERVVLSGALDLGERVSESDLPALLLAFSDALAAAAHNLGE